MQHSEHYIIYIEKNIGIEFEIELKLNPIHAASIQLSNNACHSSALLLKEVMDNTQYTQCACGDRKKITPHAPIQLVRTTHNTERE